MRRDVILNVLTSMLAVITSQLIAYPFMATKMTSVEYGFFLTTIGLVNLIAVSLGNPLNNTRLLMDYKYKDNNFTKGDFNYLLIYLLSGSILLSLLLFYCLSFSLLEILLLSLLVALIIIRSYFTVFYRIEINYLKNLYSTVCGSIGILLGIIMYLLTDIWIFIFLCSELSSCLYILIKNPLFFEGNKKTILFTKVSSKYKFLFGGAFISSLVTYMDRFFIYPVLGSEYVSYYNVASFLGKTVGIVLLPISGVLLTYYAKEQSLSKRSFYKRFTLFLVFSLILSVILLLVGPFILKILYPTIYLESLKYYRLATIGSILFILGNTVQPTMLRYSEDKWQTIVQCVYLIIYITLAIIMMTQYGLIGFCIAVILANLLKIFLMVYIINESLGDNK